MVGEQTATCETRIHTSCLQACFLVYRALVSFAIRQGVILPVVLLWRARRMVFPRVNEGKETDR